MAEVLVVLSCVNGRYKLCEEGESQDSTVLHGEQ